MVDTKIQIRGEKSWQRRPESGDMLDIAIRYEEVSQLTSSNASRSAAIADCVVVRILILVARRSLAVFLFQYPAPRGSSCMVGGS
jgi:hypothetical protein